MSSIKRPSVIIPEAISRQIAPPVVHDENTPLGGVPINPVNEETAVLTDLEADRLRQEADQRLHNRVKETAKATQEIKQSLETKMATVTSEVSHVKAEVVQVKLDVAGVKDEMSKVNVAIQANTKITEFVALQFPELIKALATDRKTTQEESTFVRRKTVEVKAHEAMTEAEVKAHEAMTEAEVKAHEAMTEAEDKSKGRSFRRKALLKLIVGVFTLVSSGTVLGFIVTRLTSC